ncbi:hypothetical protein XBKQ1_2520043 [Xenorhabdus bovienii str. kraussei Quebec]|uniref:Uncharacterized protein n=1 Tax=Xenorhabdus bovienii str. kraussei Quebec TaxID=1398203 RepID=A0A077PHQ3_XENBV|nr:hypothetical protein XBKQ1_2520043 [Xenorhabdus bovienii str. kraussei Quebec]
MIITFINLDALRMKAGIPDLQLNNAGVGRHLYSQHKKR